MKIIQPRVDQGGSSRLRIDFNAITATPWDRIKSFETCFTFPRTSMSMWLSSVFKHPLVFWFAMTESLHSIFLFLESATPASIVVELSTLFSVFQVNNQHSTSLCIVDCGVSSFGDRWIFQIRHVLCFNQYSCTKFCSVYYRMR